MTWVRKEQQVTRSHKVIKKGKGQKSTKGQRIPKDLKTTTRRKIKRTGEAQKVQTVRLTKEKEKQPTLMMMMMSSLLIKLQVESDPWVRNCPMALRLRSRTTMAIPLT